MNTTPETAPERLTIKDVVALGLKEHNGFCYEDGNDYTVRWDADGAYLSGPGHEDSAHRLDLDNASRVLRLRFPESIKDGLRESLPATINGILNATAAVEPASDQIPDGYEVVPLVDKDGEFYKHIVIPIIDREANPQFKGKIVMSTSLEEMDEASAANARKMWDDSAPSQGGLTRTFTPKQIEGGAE